MWLFYLLVFLIPTNLAKHFELDSSFVAGYLVDYLIPALYLTDILIIVLLIFKPLKTISKTLVIFLLLLLPSVVFAQSPIPAFYKWLKFLEIGLLISWIKQYRITLSGTIVAISVTAAVIFQSLLAIIQWLKQGSLFGYWFLGEQPFNAATPGIDKIMWFDGSLKIPPMGTTPHPNVLAGFLVVGLVLILQGRTLTSRVRPYWKWLAGILGTIVLFLTHSLSGWLAFLLLAIPLLIRKKLVIYYAAITVLILLAAQNFSFLAPDSSFSRRSQLAKIAVNMFKDHPLTGVGLNNFTVVMDNYGYIPASTRFLQPVHNIYLLILSETGLFGLIAFGYLLYKGRSLLADKVRPCHLWLLLFLGLFDHYPLTLQTGMLLLTLW